MRALLKICCFLSTAFTLSACDSTSDQQAPAPLATVLKVSALTLQPQTWQVAFNSYGYLESTEKVTISVDFSGTIKQVHFKQGDDIHAGQLLIELDDRKQRLRLDKARANVVSNQAQLDKAQSTFQRHRELVATGALSKEQFKQSQADFERSQAVLGESQAALSLAQQDLSETRIISPVDGSVSQRSAELGQTVLAGNPLATVEVTDTLRVVTYVSEKEVNLLRVGEVAPVTSPAVPGREYLARIELTGSSADPKTGNFVVKLTLNNEDHLLRSGMSARIKLTGLRRANTLVIPKSAVVDRNRRKVVYRVREGLAEEVEASFGVSNSDQLPVLSGLLAGDTIITSHLEYLQQGKAIAISNNNAVESLEASAQ